MPHAVFGNPHIKECLLLIWNSNLTGHPVFLFTIPSTPTPPPPLCFSPNLLVVGMFLRFYTTAHSASLDLPFGGTGEGQGQGPASPYAEKTHVFRVYPLPPALWFVPPRVHFAVLYLVP